MREQGRVADAIAYLQNKLGMLERLEDHSGLRRSYIATVARFGVGAGSV